MKIKLKKKNYKCIVGHYISSNRVLHVSIYYESKVGNTKEVNSVQQVSSLPKMN